MAEDARTVAWEVLRRVEEGGYADALLGNRLRTLRLSARDRALATRLVYGTLAWQGYLDHLLSAFSHRPPAKLEPEVRTLLRLALFQLCCLTKVPRFAAVNTAVQLAKTFRHGAAAGLVNAVLRRAASGWQQVPLPSAGEHPVRALAVRLSHPEWLVERWLREYGQEETEALLAANNEPAPTVLRVRGDAESRDRLLARLRSAGFDARAGSYSPAAIVLEPGSAPGGLPAGLLGETDGDAILQGEASQLVGFLVSPRPGERVLDACAAPGGKATHLAELMEDRGEVVATDVHDRGVRHIAALAKRLDLHIVKPTRADAARAAPPGNTPELFDRVLVDAPCSGLGTLRAHPEIRWRRTPADVEEICGLQRRLLEEAGRRVRSGGVLVYATCTLSRAENDAVLAAFREAHPAFAIEDSRLFLPTSAHSCVDADGLLRTFPHRHGMDGFFAARLKHLR